MLKQILVATVVAGSLVISGCASKGKKGSDLPPPPANSGMSSYGASDSSLNGNGLNTAGIDTSKKVIYFEYDSSDLTAAGQATATGWAKYLAANPSVRIRLEGNTDERGTREYNVSLGERRANSVQSAMTAAGASSSQLSVVSYGEERPAVPGHDESAYAQNRRVEIVQQ